MKRFLAFLLSLMMVFSLAAAQAEVLPAAAELAEGKQLDRTYKTYFTNSYASFNYFTTAYATVREIIANCIDGLVEPDIYGVYVPSLAESWEVNEDQTVWTFKLREGLKWVDHTGAETEYALTAQDFVDGIRYIGDPLNGAYSLRVVRNLISGLYDYYWLLDDIDCGLVTDQDRDAVVASFDEMVGVKALDELTVQYTLETSPPYFLSLIESSMLLLPVEYEYAVALGEDFAVDNEHMLYCGAYYVSEFERDKAITLSANPHYWDKAAITVDTVEYQMIPDGTTSLEMFKRGMIDYTTVEAEAYDSMMGTEWEDNLLPTSHSFSTNYLWLDFDGENTEFKPFINNENFRKALLYSMDREVLASLREPVDPARILRNTINAEGVIFDSTGKDYTDYSPLKEIKETDYNQPELARQYMEAAIAKLCDENGNIIGSDYIDFQIQAYSGWTYGTVADPLNYDIYFDSLSTGYADPSGILTRLTTDGAENVGCYNVPEFDALIEKALAATTFEERLQYFAEAEAYLCGNGFVIPFISSLRGYYMSYEVPHTAPLTLYGNIKYKGSLVMDEAVTQEEFAVIDAAYDAAREAVLSGYFPQEMLKETDEATRMSYLRN